MEITKVDKEKRLVTGYASTPTVDSDDEIVDLKAIKAALPGYLEWANVREMHNAKAVGTAKEAQVDDKGLLLTAYISKGAQDCWEKVLDGTLKGFSIGGNVISKVKNRITALELLEISLVDRPANPDCRFEVVKMYKDGVPVNGKQITGIALQKVSGADDTLTAEEASWFRKFVKFLKGETALSTPEFGAIHDAPVDHQAGKTDELSSAQGEITQAPVDNESGGTGKNPFHAHEWARHLEPLEAGADLKPYGEVEYADPGHQPDGKHRYPVNTEEHIRAAWSYIHKPENQKPYTAEQVAAIKSKIEAAWKSKIDEKGPPEAEKSVSPGTTKGMAELYELTTAFESLRSVQRQLSLESEIEDDPKDKEFSVRAGELAITLAGLMAEVATHEGEEATNLTDEEDILYRQWTGAELAMSTQATTTKRFSAAFKEHMGKCAANMGKAVECHGEATRAMKAIKEAVMEAHKAAKAAGVTLFKNDDLMDHIHKCTGALMDMGDRHELAAHHMDKMVKAADPESRNEGSGEDVEADGWDGIGRTGSPTGVGDTSGEEGIFAHLGGKGANPQLVKAYMDAQVEIAFLKGQQAATSHLPAGPFKAKTFDFGGPNGKGGNANDVDERQAAIFKGVNLTPIDENQAKTAVGKGIANIIGLGGANPAFDPNFKGAAGAGRK